MRSYILAKLFHHHGFVIRPVADVYLGNGLTFEGDDVGADVVIADDQRSVAGIAV